MTQSIMNSSVLKISKSLKNYFFQTNKKKHNHYVHKKKINKKILMFLKMF